MRKFRKPLISFNSKRLLRFKGATSTLEEFGPGHIFNRVYGESHANELVEPS